MPKLIRSDNRLFSTFLIHAGAAGVGSIAIQYGDQDFLDYLRRGARTSIQHLR
jgi:hypothetical protein